MKFTNNVQFLGESLTRVGIAQLDYEGKLQFMIYIYIYMQSNKIHKVF